MMEKFCGKDLWEVVLNGGFFIRSWQGQGSCTNAFSFNLETASLNIFANPSGIFTSYSSPDQTTELWKDLFLTLIIKWFQRWSHVQRLLHVQSHLDILFVNTTTQIGYFI